MQRPTVTVQACRELRTMVRDGATFKEVAEELGVHYSTVRYHVRGECSHEVAVDPVPVEA